MRVRVASVVAKTIPREPPMTAVSSMNVPIRLVNEKAARPRDIVRTYPTSTASSCQYDPSVAKNPKPIACGDGAWRGGGTLLVVSWLDACAASLGEDAASATSTNTMTERTTCVLLATQLLYAQPLHPPTASNVGAKSIPPGYGCETRHSLWYWTQDCGEIGRASCRDRG